MRAFYQPVRTAAIDGAAAQSRFSSGLSGVFALLFVGGGKAAPTFDSLVGTSFSGPSVDLALPDFVGGGRSILVDASLASFAAPAGACFPSATISSLGSLSSATRGPESTSR